MMSEGTLPGCGVEHPPERGSLESLVRGGSRLILRMWCTSPLILGVEL